jgi:GT2 family glycosyltransferase
MLDKRLLTVCIGFRNWNPFHLNRCLESLRRQTNQHRIEIVIADIGSDDEMYQAVCRLGHMHNALVVRSIQDQWSRSYALNFASKYSHADVKTLLFTDADMLFPHDWFEYAQAYQMNDETMLLTHSRDLPPELTVLHYESKFLESISSAHPDLGEGAGMIVSKEWFRRVRGFDETYKIWGCEDNDIVHRARLDGLRVEWIANTFVVHQWHSRSATQQVWEQVLKNREYFTKMVETPGPVERNPEQWAGM